MVRAIPLKCVSIAILAGLATPVFAQTVPAVQTAALTPNSDPLVPYRAYSSAVASGALADAARYANEAWQLAEAKWGGARANTAGLAFNAAWSAALVGKSAERIDAARRAVALAPIASASYSLPEAQFLLAYAEFFAADMEGRQKLAPKLAEVALQVEATWNDYLLVNALVNSANFGVNNARGRSTIGVAERALVAIDRLTPNDNTSRALALLARAQGRIYTRTNQDEAIADLIQARVAYGPMRTVDDKSWGKLAAWELASQSIVTSVNNLESRLGTRISSSSNRPLKMTEEQARIVGRRLASMPIEPNACEGVKRDRSPRNSGRDISYPISAANDARVAGVMIRHDMDAQGRVINARLLGAVPEGLFSDSAMAAVRTWKYVIPVGTSPLCLKDRDIAVSFAIGG